MPTALIRKILMKMRLVFILLLFCQSLSAQNEAEKKLRIYTSPLQLIDVLSRPMITLGGEYILFNRLGLSSEFGIKYKDVLDYDSTFVNSKGYSYRFELKFYDIFAENTRLRDYISLEYRYIKDDYNCKHTFYTDDSSQSLVTDNFGILKDIYVANIKYGMVIKLNRLMFIEPYTGLGIRYRDVKSVGRTYDQESVYMEEYPDCFGNIGAFDDFVGFLWNVSMGLKLGVNF